MRKKSVTVTVILLLTIVVALAVIWRIFMYKAPQMKFVQNMGIGINIGDSLDSYGLREYEPRALDLEFETYWGNPQITNQLFVMIKEAGFSTVRIPVTWQDHMDEDGTVREEWMDRVQEIVDMALDQDLYVILNTHHEEWMDLQPEKEAKIMKRFAGLWTQIAERFMDYDEKLVFEGMNEPRLRDSELEWTAGNEELRGMVNRLNWVFVETVRNTGGANEERFLMICPYATKCEQEAMADLEIPTGNIIVSIHMYSPYEFCQDEDGMSEWDIRNSECAKYAEEIKVYFKNMNTMFIKKDIPVIITEFGCTDKDNLDSRIKWLQFYKEEANAAGITYIWWDNGENYRIMDREKYEWTFPQIKDILITK